jgi:hypothetical protein
MKRGTTLITTLALPLAVAALSAPPAQARPSPTFSLPQAWITPAEAKDLTYLREEEKLARDVYLALQARWGLAIFGNIAQSEQTHTDAVLGLLSAYRLPDPVGTQPAGVFTDGGLQRLYAQLVAQGSRSVQDALLVGATIEDLDLSDLEEMRLRTRKADLQAVYANLAKGSRNHLRAFTRQLSARGITYAPQFISAEDYAAIIGSGTETGPASVPPGKKGGR